MKLTLPIHYKQEFKTKKPKNWLVGLNAYRNWHFFLSNDIKKHYYELVKNQYNGEKFKKVHVDYKVFVGRKNCDGHNVRSILEKLALDALVACGAIVDDSLDYVISTSSEFYLDSKNPRIEITVKELI